MSNILDLGKISLHIAAEQVNGTIRSSDPILGVHLLIRARVMRHDAEAFPQR